MVIRSSSQNIEIASPVPSPYGILGSAAHVEIVPTDDWLGGFLSQVYGASATYSLSEVLGGPDDKYDILTGDKSKDHFLKHNPFMIRATSSGSLMGAKPEFYRDTALRSLEEIQQKAIETQFWSGALSPDSFNLAGSDSVDVTPTPGTGVRPRQAQALLEGAVAEGTTGYQATLHAPRTVASVLKLKDREGVLTTTIGSKVIAGSGYNRVGPGGVETTGSQYWMYATGPVTTIIGDESVILAESPQSVDISKNNVEYVADKPAAVVTATKDVFAILVDISLDFA